MTIPATNTKLLVAEDWTKIYQSFRDADFQSYDFETLRRTMINYLRTNYPEDFNDYIDSSEYVAIIDLIAFLGQNLSFRVDLNARENFLETAQRRDSILRLAQLISYNPQRNACANGMLKIVSVQTTDNVLDSNGTNLADTTITWNDPTNTEWYQQFLNILNSAMPGTTQFGRPLDKTTISGIPTEQYGINSNNTAVPIYGFNSSINGTRMSFEIIGSSFSGKDYIYEETPLPGQNFNFIFQNDGKGSGSTNTGFFVQFKEGSLASSVFTISVPTENEIVSINANGINNSDVWLWQLNNNGNYSTLWNQVPDLVGNNVIYNSLNNSTRNVYAVVTRDGDQIDLNFADGNFGNLPKGQFVIFYRQSNGLSYSITPDQMRGIQIVVPYTNKLGQTQQLTLTMSLQYTVDNSSAQETNDSIRLKAPQTYYTQNRMITGEDYNIFPLSAGADILKIKTVNRSASGISKYFELTDITGQYSSTDIFATDGIFYKDTSQEFFNFSFTTRNEIYAQLKGPVAGIVSSNALRNFYWDQWPRPDLTDLGVQWTQATKTTNQTTGYFINGLSIPQQLGYFSSNNLQYLVPGSLIKFVPPTVSGVTQQFYNGKVVAPGVFPTATDYVWSRVVNVIADGANSGQGLLSTGVGPVTLTSAIPTGAVLVEVIPNFENIWSYSLETTIVNLCMVYRNFGLSFDQTSRTWFVINDTDVDLRSDFSLLYQGDTTNQNRDSSWIISFEWTGKEYKVSYRNTNYIFESEAQTAFYFDPTSVNYDFVGDTVIKDKITVLGINPQISNPGAGIGTDQIWQLDNIIIEPDGYQDPSKVKVSFYDANNDGTILDPDSFNVIVNPTYQQNYLGYVYFQISSDGQSYVPADSSMFLNYENQTAIPSNELIDGQLYYFYDPKINVVQSYSAATGVFTIQPQYIAYEGRSGLKFHYQHNSGDDRRIDPSKTNMMDIYMLTGSYNTAYRNWVSTGNGTMPTPPTSSQLEQNYSSYLEPIKAISDSIIYQPVTYIPLFGSQAPVSLQAKFKAVTNPAYSISSNELSAQILTTINQFFALENWDFGQSFYFSELSTYVMNVMTPYITNFVIVPGSDAIFGSLLEISCPSDSILISCAKITDIEIIDSITSSALGLSSSIITTTSGV